MAIQASPTPTTLRGQLRRHLGAYVGGLIALAVFQGALNRIDWLSKSAIDRIFSPAAGRAWVPVAIMLGAAVVAFAARVVGQVLFLNAGQRAQYELRRSLTEQLLRLGTGFYQKMSGGEIMSRATSDLEQVAGLLGFGVLSVINMVFGLTAALQVMLSISWKLTAILAAGIGLAMFASRTVVARLYERMRVNQATLGRMTDVLQSNLAGVRVVRSADLERKEATRFARANEAYLHASLALSRIRAAIGPIAGAATSFGIAGCFWYGGILLLRGPAAGGISKGAFFAFLMAGGQMGMLLVNLGFAVSIVQRGRVSFSRIREVFEAKPEVVDGTLPAPAHIEGSLKVSDLSFAYLGRNVLDRLSFDVPAGSSLAIVGRTGSGKSTLAMLLARLLPAAPHAIQLDGQDISELPLATVRQAIGYGQQDAFLFSTTVFRNIAFALPDPDAPDARARVTEAADAAQVLSEVHALPKGFDSLVGEQGVQLSGGQKQRVALARALISEPRILILDDPLSAVDAKTEASILEAIERQAGRRTVVLITHRMTAAARCDRVLFLDHGRGVACGSHQQLLRESEAYAAYAADQMRSSEQPERARAGGEWR